MRRLDRWTCVLAVVALLCASAPVAAQEEAETAASGVHQELIGNLQFTGQRLVSLAEATPENMFSWRPTKDVRSMSEVYMHIVGVNMLLPAALGATPPEGLDMSGNPFAILAEWEQTVTTKEAVIAKLEESFAYIAQAIPQIEDLDAEVELFAGPMSKRAYLLIALGHAHEHFGQSIAYARSMGVVPPWSQAQNGGGDGEDGGDGE